MSLIEKAFAVRLEILPDEHPSLQKARLQLGRAKLNLGDSAGALVLFERACAINSKNLPDEHPDVQDARTCVAVAMLDLGDTRGAHALLQEVFAVRSKNLPDEHPALQAARQNLCVAKKRLGDLSGAALLALASASSSQRRAHSWALAPRELGSLVDAEKGSVARLASLHPLCDPQQQRRLASAALATVAQLRGAEIRSAHLRSVARAREPERFNAIQKQLRTAVSTLQNAAGASLDKQDALRRAVQEKEDLERAIARLAHGGPVASALPTASDLAARLKPGSAAVTMFEYTHQTDDLDKPGFVLSERRIVGLVLERNGNVNYLPLATSDHVRNLVERIRLLGDTASTSRGRPASGRRPNDDRAKVPALLRRLGDALFDPVVAVLPQETRTLIVSVDDSLQLVPLDEAILASGESVGAKFERVQYVSSLIELLGEPGKKNLEAPTLVAFGGIDFEGAPAARIGTLGEAATPILGELGSSKQDRGGGNTLGFFPPLVGSRSEAQSIGATFVKLFGEEQAQVLLDGNASKHALARLAPQATYLHIATHGYFAPEFAWRGSGPSTAPLARFDFGLKDNVSRLSPLVLSGLALAGANLPADETGRREGIITAEELVQVDLSNCYLATLSACETSLGVRKAGQGFASLRAALQAAGARYVLATLWEVNDTTAKELMTDFYHRLWQQKQDPYDALRGAKLAAKKRGAAFRDWGGWVLSGR